MSRIYDYEDEHQRISIEYNEVRVEWRGDKDDPWQIERLIPIGTWNLVCEVMKLLDTCDDGSVSTNG